MKRKRKLPVPGAKEVAVRDYYALRLTHSRFTPTDVADSLLHRLCDMKEKMGSDDVIVIEARIERYSRPTPDKPKKVPVVEHPVATKKGEN